MATKKYKTHTIAAVVAIIVMIFVLMFASSGQTAKFFVAQKRLSMASAPSASLASSVTVGLNVDESATFNGKIITLKNVASNPTNPAPIVVDVDGKSQTVSEAGAVNGVTIKVEATFYWANDIKLRYAVLTLS